MPGVLPLVGWPLVCGRFSVLAIGVYPFLCLPRQSRRAGGCVCGPHHRKRRAYRLWTPGTPEKPRACERLAPASRRRHCPAARGQDQLSLSLTGRAARWLRHAPTARAEYLGSHLLAGQFSAGALLLLPAFIVSHRSYLSARAVPGASFSVCAAAARQYVCSALALSHVPACPVYLACLALRP